MTPGVDCRYCPKHTALFALHDNCPLCAVDAPAIEIPLSNPKLRAWHDKYLAEKT